LFGTRLETIPPPVSWPPCDARKREGKLRVGVVWAGAPAHKHDARRSLPLISFAPLFAQKNATFFSLTRDLRPGDAQHLPLYPVEDLAPRLTDFAATARIVAGLDLVVTCDTSTAHLAGGMGKPVWVLLPFSPDWRWLRDGDESPWYPSARLFRQKKPGDWPGVIAEVVRALESFGKES
jgi:hypothetical protein